MKCPHISHKAQGPQSTCCGGSPSPSPDHGAACPTLQPALRARGLTCAAHSEDAVECTGLIGDNTLSQVLSHPLLHGESLDLAAGVSGHPVQLGCKIWNKLIPKKKKKSLFI